MVLYPLHRSGKIIALFALLLPGLFGILGLVIDIGLLLATHRQTQNAADAAALALARDLLSGQAVSEARATNYVKRHQLSDAQVTVHCPPVDGDLAGNSDFVEVVLSTPAEAWFMPVAGSGRRQQVTARAVAGLKAVAAREAILTLDPNAIPGLAVSHVTLRCSRIAVNSQGAGLNEANQTVDLGLVSSALATTDGLVETANLRVVGGVQSLEAIRNPGHSELPVHARQLLRSDPLLYLPTPTTANGVVNCFPDAYGGMRGEPQQIEIAVTDNQSFTLVPGIYSSITITGPGPGMVQFSPGVYALSGGNAAGQALHLTTGASVQGKGVMFYNTGANYEPVNSGPDSSDGNAFGTASTTFGNIVIEAGDVELTPMMDGVFAGLLIYQRRWNTQAVSISGVDNTTELAGTIYARWASASVSGTGVLSTQLVVGSLSISSEQTDQVIEITPAVPLARAPQLFLVE